MADRNHCARDRALSLEDGVTVVFHKVDSHGTNSGDDDDDDEDERTAARIRVSCDRIDDAEEARGGERSPEGSERKTLCPPTFCVRSRRAAREGNADEGFLGPRDKRIYLVLRGFIGSNAMILLYYAVQQMPLADATVIMFSNPVFTSLLAWIFLKERCTIWDCVFTVFTISGVLLIARPPFLFGEHRRGIEGNYANHIKGTIAAFAGAVGAAFTFVVLRKMGRSVHYYLSVWYYAVIGLIECIITVSILGEWKIPYCGRDRWLLMLIAVLGIAGQTFLTKALQIEKAAPVALMRTIDVVLAFIFQFIFFNRAPTMWSLGGALCVVVSTSGVALQKWYSNSRKS
ncbi:solute carrier family 35 member G1 isoform X2 [Cyclopterus lumpus]|uniref:solute carrier family 35 member G1 isoform X2 n=1 Tax=Cyclopterus lumpus TaxID=8103 RepID=UPI001486AC4B|nr:solute carrier family 35 member G1 isoform X2 [Cyclopterus lumpus]